MRSNQTDAEKVLWNALRRKQLGGCRFLRQYGVGSYVLDFFCPRLRLGIELDGSHHNTLRYKNKDDIRTRYLKSLNIRVLRYWNNDVLVNTESVLMDILKEIEDIEKEI